MTQGWSASTAVVAMATTPEATTRADVSLTGLGNPKSLEPAMVEILPNWSGFRIRPLRPGTTLSTVTGSGGAGDRRRGRRSQRGQPEGPWRREP